MFLRARCRDRGRGTSKPPAPATRPGPGSIPFAIPEFDRKFAGEHLQGSDDLVVQATVNGDKVLLFLRRSSEETYSIAGFSD
jgi:hypothetical protein